MRTINSFETGDEQRSDVPASVSRRGLLAGAAGLLAWTSSQAQTAKADDCPDPAMEVDCSDLAHCPDGKMWTIVTPPHVKEAVLRLKPVTGNVAAPESDDLSLVRSEVAPFTIKQDALASAARCQMPDSSIPQDLARMEEGALRDRVTCALLARTAWRVPDSSRWKVDVGVGPSHVDLFVKKAGKLFTTIDVAGAPVESIRDSIFHMKLESDEVRIRQILLQDESAPAYPAFAIALQDQVWHEDPKRTNWMCTLINVVDWYAAQVVLGLKCRLQVPRPHTIDAEAPCPSPLKVPRYSSYPGGHATIVEALHVVLSDVICAHPTSDQNRWQNDLKLRGLADRIAENRERAGLHTSVDTNAGKALGAAIGRALIKAGHETAFGDWHIVYTAARQEWCATH